MSQVSTFIFHVLKLLRTISLNVSSAMPLYWGLNGTTALLFLSIPSQVFFPCSSFPRYNQINGDVKLLLQCFQDERIPFFDLVRSWIPRGIQLTARIAEHTANTIHASHDSCTAFQSPPRALLSASSVSHSSKGAPASVKAL